MLTRKRHGFDGTQQIKIANDRVRIVGQERKIAEMQVDHAKEVVDFLANKFTNVELYDWMSGIMEGVYSFFLQQIGRAHV